MNLKYTIGCLLVAMTWVACSDNESESVSFPETPSTEIGHEGEYREIALQAEGQWTAESTEDWCQVINEEGVGDGTLVLNVQGNPTNQARMAEVSVTCNGQVSHFTINQAALPEGEILTYKIPIIFHVLYLDEADKSQNPDAEVIYNMLEGANRMYKQAGEGSPDMKLEFYPAVYDPKGRKLEEPGIERIQWFSATLDAQEVMHNTTRDYVHLMWEPGDYTNVLLYNFSDASILGISTFPVVPKSHTLAGIDAVEDYDYSIDNLVSFRGLSINSLYMYDSNDIFADYAPDDMKELINMQNSPSVTLAHELGHYLGLFHVFSENDLFCMDTDMCEDTESYDYTKYTNQILALYGDLLENPANADTVQWANIFNRVDCSRQPYQSHNIMDYSYSYLDEFTQAQYDRVRHVLTYSPLIPGGKVRDEAVETRKAEGLLELPLKVSEGRPVRIVR